MSILIAAQPDDLPAAPGAYGLVVEVIRPLLALPEGLYLYAGSVALAVWRAPPAACYWIPPR